MAEKIVVQSSAPSVKKASSSRIKSPPRVEKGIGEQEGVRFDRADYQREYMRKRRAKRAEEKKAAAK